MKNDYFWKIFGGIVGIITFLLIFFVVWLKFSYIDAPENVSMAAEVGIDYDSSIDPYKRTERIDKFAIINGYLYQDSIPFGFDDWSWNTKNNWRSKLDSNDGSFSIQTVFLKPWGGVRLNSPTTNIENYKSVTIVIKPGVNSDILYFEFYDKYGKSMGRQLLGWYAPNSSLVVNEWNTIKIPLQNLLPIENSTITGFSISSKNEGTIYVDSVRLENEQITHDKWSYVEPDVWVDKGPFFGITQVSLPYIESFTDFSLKSWKNMFGKLIFKSDSILVGPSPKETNGSIVIYGGGENWTNYKVDANVFWGQTSTFSILSRFANDANFVSCSYSNYGQTVQIYSVANGVSSLISQTPTLAILGFEPWKNVKHAMSVTGNSVECFMDDEQVLRADITSMPKQGSVGFETWSQNSQDYPHKIQSVSVKPI